MRMPAPIIPMDYRPEGIVVVVLIVHVYLFMFIRPMQFCYINLQTLSLKVCI